MSDTARVLRPNRAKLERRPTDLESLLPEDHRARAVWEFVCGLDLSLWIYATLEGVGSARAVARLCEQQDAYRWICGGVPGVVRRERSTRC